LATNALGAGKNAADAIIADIEGREYQPFTKNVIPLAKLISAHYIPDTMPGKTAEAQADKCMSCGSCRDCHLCETMCPTGAITRRELPEIDSYEYLSDNNKCIACGFCADTCPCGIWQMRTF
ncbi:MAG: 4Fe-4S binding protein, partial [Desulfobulbaceae bacterium]|nr:4Fe-4S binding protein [Desulfobulbaceae bacterium]